MSKTVMNSENKNTLDPYRLMLNLKEKNGVMKVPKCVALSGFSIYHT